MVGGVFHLKKTAVPKTEIWAGGGKRATMYKTTPGIILYLVSEPSLVFGSRTTAFGMALDYAKKNKSKHRRARYGP